MKKKFTVEVKIPEGMTVAHMRDFIEDAVSSWGGQYEPDVDPRFDIKKAKVTSFRKPTIFKRKEKQNGTQEVVR